MNFLEDDAPRLGDRKQKMEMVPILPSLLSLICPLHLTTSLQTLTSLRAVGVCAIYTDWFVEAGGEAVVYMTMSMSNLSFALGVEYALY